MLQDFPETAPAPAPIQDDLLPRLRALWWLVPGVLLAYDVFLAVWNNILRSFISGGSGMALAMLPWLLHTGLVLGLAGFLWSRRPWPSAVQAGLLAAAALPFVHFGLGRVFLMGGLYRGGGLGFLVQAVLGPAFSLGLAMFTVSLRRGQTAEERALAAPGIMAVAVLTALSGGWVAWALLPLLSRLAGDGFAEEAADPRAAMGSPTPTSLMTAGWGGLVSAFAMVIVPLIGLLKFRGSFGPLYLVDGLALLIGCLTWTILGARWAKGRTEGRVLRILTWIALVLPVLLAGATVLLLLVLGESRLF